MAKRKKEITETLVNLDQVSGSFTSFYDKNRKIINGVGGGILVLILGFYVYKNMYQLPRQKEAVAQMAKAESLFERDSFDIALNNPGGGFPGFIEITNKYSGTPAGNLAHYYAGICLLHSGKPAEAIKHLESFSASGNTLPTMKYSLLGDAYSDQNDLEKALSLYKKAASQTKNEAVTPYVLMKLGMLSEKMGKTKEAKETYQKIKDEFGSTSIGINIDKYLYRVSQ
ncbi:MAG TPA: tetratricopeptide repeat protein [Saprospiraceae bacterium]|nr:tetratricopeptide repeat protein [Saprospiraceae bacterium]